MHFFSATYWYQGTEFSSFIYAETLTIAQNYAVLRNIGETIVGVLDTKNTHFNPQPLPSNLYLEGLLIRCCHCLTFYSWIGAKAGVVDPSNELSDKGLVHETLHELEHPDDNPFKLDIFNRMALLEHSIPGIRALNFPLASMELMSEEMKISLYHGRPGRRSTDK